MTRAMRQTFCKSGRSPNWNLLTHAGQKCAIVNRLVAVQLVMVSSIPCGFSLCGSFEPRGKRMTVMRRYSNYTMCFLAFLLLIIGAGCSDPDKAGNPGTTPPTVTSVAPPNGSAGVCPNTIVTATFSKAMNPATINNTTFLLAGPGTTAVGGVVTYDAPSKTATFTPSSTLAIPDILYTATITT